MVAIKNPEASEASPATGQGVSPSDSQQDGADRLNKPLDIIFLQDTTGSQGSYIVAARKAIRGICDKISTSTNISKDLIRFGLIAFRDHPPQDYSYVTKNFGFTSDIEQMERNLASLIASGGGDGPEAQTAAIADALNTEWAENAIKVVILITDAPPHGLGERGDGFDKSPDQNDPLELARQMAERGITLFLIACEPTLSQVYVHALDFYTALTDITSGRVFPLLMADKLGDFIVGTVVETVETERLIDEYEKVIIDDVYSNSKPMEAVSQNLQEFIASKGIKMTSMKYEDVYTHSATAEQNKLAWGSAPSLAMGRASVTPVTEPRLKGAYAAAPGFGGLFGGAPPSGGTSIFGATTTSGGASLFGGASTSRGTGLFGGAPTSSGASLFGGPTAFGATGTFGGAPTPGGTATFGATSAFGGAPTSAFGAAPTFTFGGAPTSGGATTFGGTTAFGGAPTPAGTAAFGAASAFGAPTSFGSASAFGAPTTSAGSPAPAPTPAGDVLYETATINQKQAARIVQQAVSRNSKVGAGGYVSKATGLKIPNQFEKKQ